MILSQLETRIVPLYIAANKPNGAVPLILSPPGLGKTMTASMFPMLMRPYGNYGFVEINGATLNLGTMGGYLQFGPTMDVGGVQKPTSMFSLPWWWWAEGGNVEKAKKLLNEFDGGIICVDEADKINPDENKTVGEAAFRKVWMTHEFPEGWVVWFLGNRMQDRAGSNKQFSHLINRQREIQIRPDTTSWVNWATLRGKLLPELVTFGENNPQWLFQDMPKDLQPWCTPRSLHQAEIHFRAIMEAYGMDKIPTDPLTQEEIQGGIGPGATRDLMAHLREAQELPSYKDVIANPRKAEVPSKPDGKRLMAYRLADQLATKDVEAALIYMGRYGEEFQAIFAKLAINHDYQIVFDKAFGKWCSDKSSLIAMLEQYKNNNGR
jgi:hypothetical protein